MTAAFAILPPGTRVLEIKPRQTVDPKTGIWSAGDQYALIRTPTGLREIPVGEDFDANGQK